MKSKNLLFRNNQEQKESRYQRKLITKLRAIPNSWWMVKEAKSLRGLSDIFGCVNGRFVSLEVKKSREEAEETTGRAVLQRHNLSLIEKAGGYACFVYPENEKYVLEDLISMSKAA